tara:strand:- start:2585 stop:3631 length:1047 start_codon:yes stop_codon:yes gene_type:complete
MFWIIGGAGLLRAIAEWTGSEPLIASVEANTRHTPWVGMTPWDLIFPLFVFMSGITMPYAISSKLEKGGSKKDAWKRLISRMAWLILIGFSFSMFKFDPAEFKPSTVLSLIGVSYLIAGAIVIHRPVRAQLMWAVGILVGYWLAFYVIPVPMHGAGVVTPVGNIASFLDQNLTPGKMHMGIFDPEGTIRVLPAAAMALLGAVTGHYLRSNASPTMRNVGVLVVSGVLLVGLGLLWSLFFPIIKPLWSSSYIVFSAGWSLLLLAVFYLIIDVWQQRWFGFLFLPLGMNSITIYAAVHYVDFEYTAKFFFFGAGSLIGPDTAKVFVAAGVLIIEWLLLYFLYRRRIFLKV